MVHRQIMTLNNIYRENLFDQIVLRYPTSFEENTKIDMIKNCENDVVERKQYS